MSISLRAMQTDFNSFCNQNGSTSFENKKRVEWDSDKQVSWVEK